MKNSRNLLMSYKDDSQERNCVSLATSLVPFQESQCISNKTLALNTCNTPHVDDGTINIQLPYDPDWPTKSELWDGNFYLISFHGSLEHLSSDANSIKKSLICIAKYIKNKKIDSSKSNDIEDLKCISEATWKFVSAIYKSGWDFLVTNSYNNIFRQKILYHCTLKTNLVKSGKKEKKDTNKLASIE